MVFLLFSASGDCGHGFFWRDSEHWQGQPAAGLGQTCKIDVNVRKTEQ